MGESKEPTEMVEKMGKWNHVQHCMQLISNSYMERVAELVLELDDKTTALKCDDFVWENFIRTIKDWRAMYKYALENDGNIPAPVFEELPEEMQLENDCDKVRELLEEK